MTHSDTIKYATCIVVADRGHVWVCRGVTETAIWLHLENARIIRRWGTEQGLNSLVNGPRKETILDAPAPLVSVAMRAVIAIIPCTEGWSGHV